MVRLSLFALGKMAYMNLPTPLKMPFGLIPFPWLAGKSYRRTMAREHFISRASREELENWQENALRRILTFACENVPAYEKLKSAVEKLPPREALKAFPLLDKEELQQNFNKYLPRNLHKIRHFECSTGGTSGNQLTFYLDDDAQAIEMAFMHRLWSRVGYSWSSKKATFRGVEFKNLANGIYWQPNPIYNELQFSPYHMNENTLDKYVEKLLAYKPEFLHGYPSAITLLAGYVLRHEINLSSLKLKGVLLGSEALLPGQRETMEEAFKTRIFSWYGHSEKVILGGECEHSTAYHHFPDYGFLEIVDEQGDPVKEGEVGELVGTGFYNQSLPLIRYRTGDRARRLDYHCTCKRNFERFDQVEGRWKQEYIIGRNRSRISLAALNMHGPFFKHVLRYQYYQNTPGEMELRLMVTKDFEEKDAQALLEAFHNKTQDELKVTIKIVEDIPLTPRGKLKRLIQEIPKEQLE